MNQYVLVFTPKGDIWFGRCEESIRNESLTLYDAQQVVSYSGLNRGILGCAFRGPDSECRISPTVAEIHIRQITQVVVCNASDEARKRWRSEPWK